MNEDTRPVNEPRGPDPLVNRLRRAGARPGLPPATAERLRRVAEEALARKRASLRRRRMFRVVAAAAAVILIAFVARYAPWSVPGDDSPVAWIARVVGDAGATTGTPVSPGEVLATGGDEMLTLRAASGHSIRLAPGSRLRFTTGRSVELMTGAVYIDSGDGPAAQRIAVETALGRVEELGTRYRVRTGEGSVAVAVRSGSIALEHAGRQHRAEAGTELTIDLNGVSQQEIPVYGEGWEWVLGAAVAPDIEGRPLAELLDWVTRETGWQLEYTDAATAERAPDIVVHGSVKGLSPEDALAVTLPACGLAHRRSSGKLLVGALPLP